MWERDITEANAMESWPLGRVLKRFGYPGAYTGYISIEKNKTQTCTAFE